MSKRELVYVSRRPSLPCWRSQPNDRASRSEPMSEGEGEPVSCGSIS